MVGLHMGYHRVIAVHQVLLIQEVMYVVEIFMETWDHVILQMQAVWERVLVIVSLAVMNSAYARVAMVMERSIVVATQKRSVVIIQNVMAGVVMIVNIMMLMAVNNLILILKLMTI